MQSKAETTTVDWKEVLKKSLIQIGIVKERFTGEITIGITDGGIKFVRKSENVIEPESQK